jgi:DNA-binding transcriptional LysR family regulator
MDRLTSIRVFVTVAENGRFRVAASRLKMSPPMVSKHIGNLEDHLGVRLLNRNSRNVSLTEDGLAYLDRARTILDELDDLESTLTSRSELVRGTIRLTAPVWMANTRFVSIISDFMRLHPQCHFEIDLRGSRIKLVEEGFDLALRVGGELDPGLISRVVGQVQFRMLATPAFLATLGNPRERADLHGQKLLAYSGMADRQRLIFGDEPERAKLAMNIVMRSENETLLRLAALEGLGVVFLPDWLAREDLESGALVPVLPDDPGLLTNINAVFSSRRLLPRNVRAFIDHLVEVGLGLEQPDNRPTGQATASALI